MATNPKTAFAGSQSTMRVPQLAKELQIGLVRAYELVRTPGFPAFKVGGRIIISKEGFQSWLAQQADEQSELEV